MKYASSLLPTILLFAMPAISQEGIQNQTSLSFDSSLVFVGIKNSVKIFTKPGDNYLLKSQTSRVEKTNKRDVFDVYPLEAGIDTFSIVRNNMVIFQKPFLAVRLSPPIVALGNINSGYSSAPEIIANGGIIMRIPNCNCMPVYEIISFAIDITSNSVSDLNKKISVKGTRLTKEAIAAIKLMKPNDVVTFRRVRMKSAATIVREFPPFSITIK
jgi:hypothetical protein